MFGAKTPFGGGGFGSTTTNAFGTQQTPSFGAGLFGNKTPSAGAFGTPSFGTPSSGGLFGGTSSGSNIFGAKPAQSGFGFGATGTSSGGLFGASTGSSLFQTTPQTSNAFGKTSGISSFGSSNSAFGATSGSSLFGGGTSSSSNMFGGSTAFGQPSSGTTTKFAPVTSTETTQKGGVSMTVKTQNQCITIMDAYKDKSVEELRLEDYAAGRKGSAGSTFGGSTGLFSNTGASTGTSIFANTAKFGQNTSTGLFGNTSSGGLFGAKTTSSIFGPIATTSTSGIGGFGTGSTNIFGNTPSVFGQAATSSSGSLFGNNNTIFGNTSTGFGSTSQGTGLFSTSKPSIGSNTGFGTTGGFGSATSTGGGLFGATSKPGFTFSTGTTGFGATSNTGLFGGTSGGLFGNKSTGFGTTGFGASTGTTGSLFGGSTLGGGTTGFTGFGSTQNTGLGGSSLGGLSNVDQNTLAAIRQQQMMQQQLKAIANTPFGDSPLFRNLAATGDKKDASKNLGLSSVGVANKEPMNASQYKVFSRPAAKVKLHPVSSPSLGKSRLFDGLEDEGDFSPHPLNPRRSVKKLVIKNKPFPEVDSSYEEGQLKLRSFNDADDDLIAPSPEVIKTKNINETGGSQMSTDGTKHATMFDNTITELNAAEKTPILKKQAKNYVLTPLSDSVEEAVEDRNDKTEVDEEYKVPKSGIILRRAEYYTKPSIDSLDDQVRDDQCLVRDFTVGREGYGEVKFLGVTNVYNLDLDKIVFFQRREVEVYPDNYENKPQVSEELNKPAEITLLKVWPNDKSSHTPVKTPERLKASGFIDRLEENTLAMDAVFVDYRPQEGAWVFKVNHFTRYGIQEQYIGEGVNVERRKRILREKVVEDNTNFVDFHKDDEDIVVLTKDEVKMKLKQKIAQIQSTRKAAEVENQVENSDSDIVDDDEDEDDEEEDDEDDEILTEPENNENIMDVAEEDFMPLSHQLGRIAHVQPFHLQGMKTSVLYDDEDEENRPTPKTMLRSKSLFSNKSIFNSSYIDNKQTTFTKLDTSKSTSLAQDILNNSVFLNVTSEKLTNVGNSAKIQKKSHLFKSGLSLQNSFAQEETKSMPDIERPVENNMFIKCRTYSLVPHEKSLLFGRASMLADSGLVHGREFNIGWTNKLTFLHSGEKLGVTTDGTRKHFNIFQSNFTQSNSSFGLTDNNVYMEAFQSPTNEGLNQYIENCLSAALKHTQFEEREDSPLGLLKIKSPTSAIAEYAEIAKGFKQGTVGRNSHELTLQSCVWDLVSALWGQQETDETGSMYEVHSSRKLALSKWLATAVENDVRAEIEANKTKDDGHLAVIFNLLSGNQVQAACEVARENKEMRLSFLLAQITGDHHLKQYIRNQLSQWEERNIDEFINGDRLKLYVLLSGMMVWKSTTHHINLCDNVKWKRSLGLHLWYYCSSTATILDAFTEYQNSFKGTNTYEAYAGFPSPDYSPDAAADDRTKDICYHLLALYCKRSHSLGNMLTPKTYTSNQLDYHLSWHLHQVLDELGYNHMTQERHSFLQCEYASQLENIGLWHWAVFVLMHLQDDVRREYSVKDILNRNCQSNDDEEVEFDLSKEEEMIVDQFKVPVQWLHEAKALHCKYTKRYYEETVHLIRAAQWDKAHVVLLNHLAADSIIEEEYETLKKLLQDLNLPERCCTIKNWRIGGQVFLDYIMLNEKLEDIRENKNTMTSYHLEDMEAEIASLINRISLMKVKNSRGRLCQSEMARTCSNMLKIVFSLLKEEIVDEEHPKWSSVKVVPYVVDLPLPPDYYLKELRELLANFADEIENPS